MTKNNAEKSTSENVLMSARDVQPFDLPEPLKKLGNKTTKLTGQVHMDVTYRSVSYGNAFLCLLTTAADVFSSRLGSSSSCGLSDISKA